MIFRCVGLPLSEALASLPEGEKPKIVETSAPRRDGSVRSEGTLRLVACRQGVWIVSRFLDQDPKTEKEDT